MPLSADTGEPLLLTGDQYVTDMTFRQVRALTQFWGVGVSSSAALAVTSPGAGQIAVAAGSCLVRGTYITGEEGQFNYLVPLSAAKTLSTVPTPAVSTRYDRVSVVVLDNGDDPGSAAGENKGIVTITQGVEGAGVPPSAPNNSYTLATYSITTGGVFTITDARNMWGPLVPGLDGTKYRIGVDAYGALTITDATA